MTLVSTDTVLNHENILARAAAVEDLSGYPPVDKLLHMLEDLRQAHPDLIAVQRIGTSRLGEPIPVYTISSADAEPRSKRLRGLVVGGVHPNEPIGSWTLLHLMRQLCIDSELREYLNTEWHIVPCADPDAMRLNEEWFANAGDPETYFRNFYRPAGNEQVEWTFPFSYKSAYFDAMLPETQALQRAIDRARPDFYVPLHNAESGGAYYYLSKPVDQLYTLLHDLPERLEIPLHLGEPESAHFNILSPAIFEMGTLEDAYDWTEGLGLDPAPPGLAGDASTSYALKNYGTLSLIAELPIWKHLGADNTSETDQNYAELLRQAGEGLADSGALLNGMLKDSESQLTLDTPFLRAARSFLPGMQRAADAQLRRAQQPENDRLATVAEITSPMSVVWMFRLRFGGMFLRALQAEVTAGTASPEIRHMAVSLDQIWSRWLKDKTDEHDTAAEIPVSQVVGLQYGAVLGLAAHVRARN